MAIRVAVVGLGARGAQWIRLLPSMPAFVPVAYVDRNDALRQGTCDAANIPSAQRFADLTDAFARADVQAAIIATAPDDHADTCRVALAKNVAVLVEKPFTTCLADAVTLVEFAERQHVPLLVAQNYRYMRAYRTMRRLVGDGALGRVRLVTCQYYRVPHDIVPSLARMSHAVLWGMSIHHLDALRWVLGQQYSEVSATTFTASPDEPMTPAGASLQALLTFDGGTRAVYTASYESSGHEFFERGQEFYCRLVGERATLHVFHRWLVLCERGRLPRVVRRAPRHQPEEHVLLQQLQRAIAHGEAAETSGRDNLCTMAAVEACIRSSSEGRRIDPRDLLRCLNQTAAAAS